MPWKKDFTLSDEMSPSGIVWPAGKAAVSVVVDYSVPAGAEGIDEAAIAYARTVWGNAVSGGWLIDYLNAYGVKATFAVPAGDGRAFPEIVRRAMRTATKSPPVPSPRRTWRGFPLTKNGNALSGRFRGLRS